MVINDSIWRSSLWDLQTRTHVLLSGLVVRAVSSTLNQWEKKPNRLISQEGDLDIMEYRQGEWAIAVFLVQECFRLLLVPMRRCFPGTITPLQHLNWESPTESTLSVGAFLYTTPALGPITFNALRPLLNIRHLEIPYKGINSRMKPCAHKTFTIYLKINMLISLHHPWKNFTSL